jgi:tetratricopeptide (TPR) repeat protein/predicted Ser/Thr protein kinase
MVTPASPEDDAAAWARVEAALDEVLALPAAERAAAVRRIAGADAALAAELHSLLARAATEDSLIDRPAAALLVSSGPGVHSLTPGTRLGAWAVVETIGRGGMGQVYRGRRADGQFEQDVAIKLARADSAMAWQRFPLERQIVARLDHPGIARLIDGGIADSGQPYMVMELVTGQPITRWCDEHACGLAQRLDLFEQVCDAVAFAHRHLIIHRDIKPSNVMVTDDGRVKLLDFGIARLLDTAGIATTAELMLTPAYSSPEQLSGQPLSTATDVYGLGLLLHELLTGQSAQNVAHMPMAAAIHAVLSTQPRPPSSVARTHAKAPVAAPQLIGDLDAIVAKALRKEPEQRYASVDSMAADLQRYRAHLPVQARRGNWQYTVGRALRRHRTATVAAAVVLIALIGGSGAVAWQARVARTEAARATAVKNFLLQVFKASDPRLPSDAPRGTITARALLDTGASRIESDFRDQPDLQIELLGVVGGLYRELGETAGAHTVTAQRLALADRQPGRHPQVEIDALMDQVSDDLDVPDRDKARAKLADADKLIHQAGVDNGLVRALWWTQKARAEPPTNLDAQQADYEQALKLYQRVAPRDAGRVRVLAQMGNLAFNRGLYDAAIPHWRAALAALPEVDERIDGEMVEVWGNIALANVVLGRYDDAGAAYAQAIALTERTYGPHHPEYWRVAGEYANLLHLMGHRDEAMQRFQALRTLIPDPPTTGAAWSVLVNYASRLAAQGEPERAVAWMEAHERFQREHQEAAYALRRTRLLLGNIYSLLGRRDEARQMLKACYDEYAVSDKPDSLARMGATERWARVVLEDGQAQTARALFLEVIDGDHDRHLVTTALAKAGLARVELALQHADAAVREGSAAVELWHQVKGYHDVRAGPVILRVLARAQLAHGDAAAAKATAEAALQESLRYDAPGAASITEARDLIAKAQTAGREQ